MTSLTEQICNAKLAKQPGELLALIIEDKEVGFWDANFNYYGDESSIPIDFCKKWVSGTTDLDRAYHPWHICIIGRNLLRKINGSVFLVGIMSEYSLTYNEAITKYEEDKKTQKKSIPKPTYFQRLFGTKS